MRHKAQDARYKAKKLIVFPCALRLAPGREAALTASEKIPHHRNESAVVERDIYPDVSTSGRF